MANSVFNPSAKKSAGHMAMRRILKGCYGNFHVQEEYPVNAVIAGRKTVLYIDFVIHELKVAFEVHGRQHFEFVAHFHSTPEGFNQSKHRDDIKAQSIADNGYTLIVIKDEDTVKMTQKRLLNTVSKAIKKNIKDS